MPTNPNELILNREETLAFLAERGIERQRLPGTYWSYFEASDENGPYRIHVKRVSGNEPKWEINLVHGDRYRLLELFRDKNMSPENKLAALENILNEHDVRFLSDGWLYNERDY